MLLGLLEKDGHELKYVATTYGGEYAGPCPWCGGDDRFRVWSEQDRYWCRQCNRTGDVAKYLLEARGIGYKEACNLLGPHKSNFKRNKGGGRKWNPKKAVYPDAYWQAEAEQFQMQSQRLLQSDLGQRAIRWLKDRGLVQLVIMRERLGLNPRTKYHPKKKWGLKDTNGSRRIWLPSGLVIPCYRGNQLIRLRIRTKNRYVMVSGSCSVPKLWDGGHNVFVVVESELDGMLVWQKAMDWTNVIALGSVAIKPDQFAHRKLVKSDLILLSLDSDKAGIKASHEWWLKNYPHAKRWPCPIGKDPGEAYKKGLDIQKWIKAGIGY